MSGMQDIEAAVGDGQCAALVTQGLAPGGQGVGREDFIAEIQQANPAADGKCLSIGGLQRKLSL